MSYTHIKQFFYKYPFFHQKNTGFLRWSCLNYFYFLFYQYHIYLLSTACKEPDRLLYSSDSKKASEKSRTHGTLYCTVVLSAFYSVPHLSVLASRDLHNYIYSWYNSGTVCIWYLSFSCNPLELLCTELFVKKAKIAKTLQVISMAEPLRIQPLLSAISYAITSLCIFSSNQHTFF